MDPARAQLLAQSGLGGALRARLSQYPGQQNAEQFGFDVGIRGLQASHRPR
jgi:hypothetical protein